MKKVWRRFRRKARRAPIEVSHNDQRLTGDIYAAAHDIVDQHIGTRRWWRRRNQHDFDGVIETLRGRAETSGAPEHWLAALIVQTPRAVAAQRSMDKHPHGYHSKQARLFELIDFNDSFVNTVLALPDEQLASFNDEAKKLLDRFCRYTGSPSFSNEQWQAITHGLGREIAVYRSALALGYRARMTSRRDDAMGVDMVIADQTGHSVNLDIKTRSSFHFRLKDLVREGRLSEEQRLRAELTGYQAVVNGHGDDKVATTLLRIDEEMFGLSHGFVLERPEKLRDILLVLHGEARGYSVLE